MAEEGKLDPIIGREQEINRIAQILSRRKKNNPIIIGEPGAGKSTLLLQTMCYLAEHMSALYITGEESLQQVAMRAKRLGLPTNKLKMLSETSVENI